MKHPVSLYYQWRYSNGAPCAQCIKADSTNTHNYRNWLRELATEDKIHKNVLHCHISADNSARLPFSDDLRKWWSQRPHRSPKLTICQQHALQLPLGQTRKPNGVPVNVVEKYCVPSVARAVVVGNQCWTDERDERRQWRRPLAVGTAAIQLHWF